MKNREKVLKELREKNQVPFGITTHEAADILNVSFTTIITWIKDGKIKCNRTIGGHRRIPPNEIEKMSKILSENKEDTTSQSITKTKPVNKSTDKSAKLKTPVKTSHKPKIPIKTIKRPVTKPLIKATIKKSTSNSKKNVSVSKAINPTNKV